MCKIETEEYQEIWKLREMMDDAGLQYVWRDTMGGHQLIYIFGNDIVADVIEHDFSYGAGADLLELRGLLTKEEKWVDSVKGFMTAEEVFARFKAHHDQTKK